MILIVIPSDLVARISIVFHDTLSDFTFVGFFDDILSDITTSKNHNFEKLFMRIDR